MNAEQKRLRNEIITIVDLALTRDSNSRGRAWAHIFSRRIGHGTFDDICFRAGINVNGIRAILSDIIRGNRNYSMDAQCVIAEAGVKQCTEKRTRNGQTNKS